MKKGLVLGGGGSKGAYEIGVWKALDELQMSFDLVCGTSIGAMNGVLYVQQDYQKAYDLWKRIEVDDVFEHGVSFDKDIDLLISQKEKYLNLLNSYIKNKGVNITPFIQTITPLFDSQRFFDSPIDYACMTYNFSEKKAQPFLKKDMSAESVLDYVIASASCFPAFPMKEINQQHYIDGGYYDNVPVDLAKEMGADYVVATDLKPYDYKTRHEEDPTVIYIQPRVSLGSFLLFDHDRIDRNMALGYQDTMKAFHKFYGTIYTFSSNDEPFIKEVDDYLQSSVEEIYSILNDDELPMVFERVRDYRNQQYLKPFEYDSFSYVAMLEDIAWQLDMSDVGVWNFSQFLKELYQQLSQRNLLIDNLRWEVDGIVEFASYLKNNSELDCICFIYQYLMDQMMNEQERMKIIHALRIIFNDSFAKACCIYAYGLKYEHRIQN